MHVCVTLEGALSYFSNTMALCSQTRVTGENLQTQTQFLREALLTFVHGFELMIPPPPGK